MTSQKPDFDVAVIGGGPAGSSMAAYLAKGGARVVVFERELFPRPHVGESLVPSSTRVLRELGLLEKMEAAKFPHKMGAIWTSLFSKKVYEHDWEGLSADDFADIRFDERKMDGVDQKYTYHVDRGIFDQMLLQHAQELGAHVCEGVDVSGVDFSDPDCAKVRFKVGPKEFVTSASVVVDASGRRTLVGTQLGLKQRDKVFNQVALHTWFEDYDRTKIVRKPEHEAYIHVHFLPIRNSWIWQIPITDTITSLGVVTQAQHFAQGGQSHQDFFWTCVKSRPDLYDALQAAKRVRPFKTEGDYSYAMKEITGDRMLLIGDAARFVDPIFSTGVSIALNCARFASRDVLKALETGDFSKASFDTYATTIRRGTRNWYNFISVYYRLNVLFTSFILDPKYRTDVLKLLQGDVYDEDSPKVLETMRAQVKEVEDNPQHPWHRFLGELTAENLREAY